MRETRNGSVGRLDGSVVGQSVSQSNKREEEEVRKASSARSRLSLADSWCKKVAVRDCELSVSGVHRHQRRCLAASHLSPSSRGGGAFALCLRACLKTREGTTKVDVGVLRNGVAANEGRIPSSSCLC